MRSSGCTSRPTATATPSAAPRPSRPGSRATRGCGATSCRGCRSAGPAPAGGRGDPLATSGAYRRAMAGLPADRVADAFVTAAGVRRLLDPAGGLLGAMGTLLDRPGLQAAGLSLSADAPGARLVVHKLSSPGGATAYPPLDPALAGEVPRG